MCSSDLGFGVFLCLNFLLFSKAIFYFNYLDIEIFIFCAKISLSGREDFPLPEFVETSSNTKAKYHKSTRRMNMKRKRNLYHLWFCFAMLLFLAVPFKVKAETATTPVSISVQYGKNLFKA